MFNHLGVDAAFANQLILSARAVYANIPVVNLINGGRIDAQPPTMICADDFNSRGLVLFAFEYTVHMIRQNVQPYGNLQLQHI